MKAFVICALLAVSGFGLYKLFQNPEKYLKKKTEYLIKLSSVKSSKVDMALISQVTKIAKFIHYDVQVKAEYEGQVYQARSLNEFRSHLMAYFRQSSTGSLEYENLTVQMKDHKKRGLVSFDAFFNRASQKVFCKIVLEWEKEKKWFVKRIEVHSCKPVN
ncbi:MAG: hypothetical protein OXJ52_02290 [Oligoflexia bacterium]|nr:hypothetical protein [Oligoflexia bacterium]